MPGGTSGHIDNRNIADGSILPQKFSSRNRRYTFDRFDVRPAFAAAAGHGAPVGTVQTPNIVKTGVGTYEYAAIVAQTIVAPVFDVTNGLGLDIAQDVTPADGVEWNFGPNIVTANQERGKHNYKIGSEPAPFFARVKVFFTDCSGVNPFVFGFRKVQALSATPLASYTDYAIFKAVVSAAIADISVETRLNNGTAVTVDTTQDLADLAARTFEIRVRPTGQVEFRLDSRFPTATKTDFVFDTGDVLIPFLVLVHGADSAELTFLQEFEAGYLQGRGE